MRKTAPLPGAGVLGARQKKSRLVLGAGWRSFNWRAPRGVAEGQKMMVLWSCSSWASLPSSCTRPPCPRACCCVLHSNRMTLNSSTQQPIKSIQISHIILESMYNNSQNHHEHLGYYRVEDQIGEWINCLWLTIGICSTSGPPYVKSEGENPEQGDM